MKISYKINNLKYSEFSEIKNLINQLTKRKLDLKWKNISDVMKNEIIFVARDKKNVIGLTILTKTWKPTAFVGTIEDVVVDEKYRGQGIGKRMIFLAIAKAKKLKMNYLKLTSHASRVEANFLYQKMGFKKRETNVYRMEL